MKTVELLSIIISLTGAFSFSEFSFSNAPKTNQPQNNSIPRPVQQATSDDDFEPIDNMHHFMKYICEPSSKGLKQLMATEPADRKAWEVFKNHALLLAETSALVATRGPEDKVKNQQWKAISAEVYRSGKSLYKSSGNYVGAKIFTAQCLTLATASTPFSPKGNSSSQNNHYKNANDSSNRET
jgi:hypothetical protein